MVMRIAAGYDWTARGFKREECITRRISGYAYVCKRDFTSLKNTVDIAAGDERIVGLW